MLGRRQRRAVRLVELPTPQRAPVISAYLHRAGPRGRVVDRRAEARRCFGVSVDAPLTELEQIASYYPVVRILDWSDRRW